MTYEQYIDYFIGIAQNHTDIQHNPAAKLKKFFMLNPDEIGQDMKSKIDPDAYVLAVEKFEFTAKDLHSDNHLHEFTGAFSIIKRVVMDDFEAEKLVIDKCAEIAIDITNRMYEDSLETGMEEDCDDRLFKNIEPDSFVYNVIGPIYNKWHGVRVMFNFSDTYEIDVDATKWLDL